MKTNMTIEMKKYMKYICLIVLLLGSSVRVLGSGEYNLPLTVTTTGCTYIGSRRQITDSEWSTKADIVLPFTVSSGYDASIPYTVSWTTGGSSYTYGWSWDESAGELTLYGSSLAPKYSGSVTVDIAFERQCTVLATPTGMATSSISSVGATFSWTAVTNASSYRLYITDATNKYEYDDISGTSKVVTGLSPSTDYIWTVRANGTGDYCNSDECVTQEVTTLAPASYDVTFSVGSGDAPSKRSGSSITLPAIPAVCAAAAAEGWEPYGWSETEVAGNSTSATVYDAGDEYIPERNCTLYAVYKKTGSAISSTNFSKISATIDNLTTAGTFVFTKVNGDNTAISNTVSGNYVNTGSNTISSSTLTTTDGSVLWTVWEISGSPKYYTFENVATGKYLATDGDGKATLVSSSSGNEAKWTVEMDGSSNGFYFKNKATSQYLRWTASGWKPYGTQNGTDDHIYAYYNSTEEIPIQSIYQSSLNCTTYYNVFYDDNEAESGTVPTDATDYASNANVTVKGNTGTLTKTGYTFGGWNTRADGTGTNYTAGSETFVITANTTLYAKWNVNSHNVAVASKDKITISATPSGGSTIAAGANTDVNYGKTVTLSYSSLDASATFIQWKVTKQSGGDDVSDELCADKTANNTTFTMPDYAVNITCVLMAELRTSCQTTVTYHYPAGTTVEKVAIGGNPVGYTAPDCENKRFVGWSATDVGSTLTQVAPAMVDPTTQTITEDTHFYAVYASPNGGKVTGAYEMTHRDIVTDCLWTKTKNVLSKAGAYTYYTMGTDVKYQGITRHSATYCVMEFVNPTSAAPQSVITGKIRDLSAIQFEANTANCTFTYNIYVSLDGSIWTNIGTNTLTGNQESVTSRELATPSVDDYYVKIELSKTAATSLNVGIKQVIFKTKARSVWYSDYSNGCDVAASATLTYKDTDGTTTVGTPHTATPSVPERYEVEAQTKSGYTFDYITVDGQTYYEGDTYLLAHDVNAVITWKENPTITGTAHATSVSGVKVQPLDIITATTTGSRTGTLTIADATGSEGGTFHAVITDGTVSGAALNANILIQYTPSQANVTETATMTAVFDGCETEFTVYGRSLPEKFVIAAQIGGQWRALPADLATNSGTAVQDAYIISVDNTGNPTSAVAPKTAIYSAAARNNATKHIGGVRLHTETGTSDGYLQAPRSNSLTYLWRASSTCSTGMQEWYLSSTNLQTYTIGVDPTIVVSSGTGTGEGEGDSSTPLSRYLCVYNNQIMWSNTSSKTFRILPVTEYEPVELQVVEWKSDKVVFMYLGNPDYEAEVQINNVTKAATAELSTLKVDEGVYEIAVSDLMTSAYQKMQIIIKNGGTEVGRKMVNVPLMVNTTTTVDAARTSAGISNKDNCSSIDLVVLSGGKLSTGETTDGSKFTFNSLTIYGGGKFIMPTGTYFAAKAMYLRAGTVNSGTYQYVYPQLYLGSDASLSVTGNTINFDYLTTKSQYYAVALPYGTTINNTNIFYPEDIYGSYKTGSYLMDYFDSSIRASRGAVDDVWTDLEDAVPTRGLGYYFLGMPRKMSINGGTAVRQEYGIQRIKMDVTSAVANENADASIALTFYDSEQIYNAGWNFLGNPFMADITSGGDDAVSGHIYGNLTFTDNTWGINKTVRYITVPNDEAMATYDQRLAKDYTFPAFKTFYVQIGSTGSVTFSHSRRASAMPRRAIEEEMPSEINCSVALSSATASDTTHLLIGDMFTEAYEPGDDLVKMGHNNVNVFTVSKEIDLFANALNKTLAEEGIPVGYIAPDNGTYTFSLDDAVDMSWIEHVWLTDYETSAKVDLLTAPYEFEAEAGTNKTRFVLNIILKTTQDDPISTGVDSIEGSDEEAMKFIYRDKLYIRHKGVIYDATGKEVSEIK